MKLAVILTPLLAAAPLAPWCARPTIAAEEVSIVVDTLLHAPKWATLERQLLTENARACREFFKRYFDDRGYYQCIERWGGDDGPDDAIENCARWPELHALGSADDISTMYQKAWEGHLRQYTEARTVDVPMARQGMYYKEFPCMFDWMHIGEGLRVFNRQSLSDPLDENYQRRARRYAGFYMNEDPEAPNYDPQRKIIKSLLNGSRGPLMRKATPLDWAGDPIDVTGLYLVHHERSYQEMLDHFKDYTDVVGDHPQNLGATTLALNAYMLAHQPKYKKWLLEYVDAWLDRMQANDGIIPSNVGLDGTIGGQSGGRWYGGCYGWAFTVQNPQAGQPNHRCRVGRALPGFNNALLVTGDQKYVAAWRNMIEKINSHSKIVNGVTQYPHMYGDQGWYAYSQDPYDVGALEVYYWSMNPDDLKWVDRKRWIAFLQGENPAYPETALEDDLRRVRGCVEEMRRDMSTPKKRLADHTLEFNPATTDALVQLMLGGLPPGRDGGVLNCRLRYFDPQRKRAGVPEDVAALVDQLTDTGAAVTLVNLDPAEPRTVIVQAGAYGEHRFDSVSLADRTVPIHGPLVTVRLQPGCGARLTFVMQRYVNQPTVLQPWHRPPEQAD